MPLESMVSRQHWPLSAIQRGARHSFMANYRWANFNTSSKKVTEKLKSCYLYMSANQTQL